MMRIMLLAAAIAAALPVCPAAAQSVDMQACSSAATQPAAREAACTRAIRTGGLSAYDLSTLYTHRGIARRLLNRYDDAVADYNTAIGLDAKNAQAFHSRGTISYLRGQFARTIEDGDRALALDAKYAIAHEQRGLAHYRLEQFDQAMADYDATLRLLPDRALARYARGVLWRRRGDAARATADMSAARAANPRIAEIAEGLGIR